MADTHWFDMANKLLTSRAKRRGLSSLLAALFTIASYDQNGVSAGKGKGGKGNGNNGKKGGKKGGGKGPTRKPAKPVPRSCSDGACAKQFSSRKDRDWCEFICRQCDGDDPATFASCFIQ